MTHIFNLSSHFGIVLDMIIVPYFNFSGIWSWDQLYHVQMANRCLSFGFAYLDFSLGFMASIKFMWRLQALMKSAAITSFIWKLYLILFEPRRPLIVMLC